MRRALALSIVHIILCCAVVPLRTTAQTTAKAPVITKSQWRADLRYFATELPRRHKNLYHATSQEQFARAVAELDAAIPSLQDHQIIVRLRQISATIGDGHTGVHMPLYFKRYPLAVSWFGRDLRVVAAAPEYERAKGTRVVKIGDLTIDEVQSRVATCLPSAQNENEWFVLNTSPAFILIPEVLHALGILPAPGSASFTFEDDEGKQFTVDIAAVELTLVDGVPTLKLGAVAKKEPLYRQRAGESFWFTYLADSQTVYVNFRSYKSLGENARNLFKFIDSNPTARLIIDLRQNGGGDFFEGRGHLVRPIKERPTLNRKGHLFVIIGRRTFSAAMVNAIDFRKETNAILVGEPIGERPNSYSENDEFTLPNSKLVVSYSTRYYKFVDEDVPAVMPDQRIDPDWPAFREGRDPVMEWIMQSTNSH